MAKFRISSLYVDLVYQLGTILRVFRELTPSKPESWTFTFSGVSASYKGRNPVTYYGKGTLDAINIPLEYRRAQPFIEDTIQVRVMCDLFPEDDYDQWIIYYWVKYPNGSIVSSHAEKREGTLLKRGGGRTSDQPPLRTLGALPPPELKFK